MAGAFKDVEEGDYNALQVREGRPEAEWDGACHQCCGTQYDETGWAIFSTTWLCPCVQYGFNTRRAFGTFWKGFFLVAWIVSAGELFNGYRNGCLTVAGMKADSWQGFVEGWQQCQSSPGYYFFFCLLLVTWFVTALFLARNRSEIRKQLGIRGSFFKDYCLWLWCFPCAMCQEGRTLKTRNVEDGVVNGGGEYVPVAPAVVPPTMPSMR